jgi:cytochrome c
MWNKEPAMLGAMRARGMTTPRLRPEEMADLIGYLYSVRYFAESGSAVRGRSLLRQKGCLECHGLNGQGDSSAADLGRLTTEVTPAFVISALWNHTFLAEEATNRMLSWPAFGPGDMADLTAFLQSVARPQ